MDSQDLEFVELTISEPIGLSFHGLDLGVGAFQWPRRYWVVVVRQDARLVLVEGVGELLQHTDARGPRPRHPVAQHAPRGSLVGLTPDLPEVLLEVVGDRQRLVQLQGVPEALLLVAFGIEVLRVLQQQPAGALEQFPIRVAGGLVVQFPTQSTELVVEQLDDVEVVEDMDDVGKVVADGPDVGLAHVGGHGPDLGPRRPQPPPEWLQGLDSLAIADKNHSPGNKVQDHREVIVSFANGDLVNGDLLQLPQLRCAKPPLKRRRLDGLDRVPTHLQVLGNRLDGHVTRQIEGITLEGPRVTLARVGEAQLDLADVAAGEAPDPRHLEFDLHGLGADGHGAKRPGNAPLGPHVIGTTGRAAELVAGLTDAEGDPPPLERRTDVAVAAQSEGVVQ